jgi:LmbE family N-acetylglucosaminyl deacetylase
MRMLVVAPHTDDAELGAGATIARLTDEGHEIWIANLSDTSNIGGKELGANLRRESINACAELGLREDFVLFGDFNTRNFHQERQNILDYLISARNQIMPDVVICPSMNDVHQDHAVVSKEVARAFSGKASILGYDTYWNINNQDCTFVVEVSEKELQAKVRALAMFDSQKNRPYMDKGNIEAQAKVRGLPRGYQYAEAFSVIEISLGKEFLFGNA